MGSSPVTEETNVTPIIAVQELGITLLEFSLRLAHHKDKSWDAICDEFRVDWNDNTIELEFTIEGIALLDLKVDQLPDEDEPLVILQEDYFGGIDHNIPSKYFKPILNALNNCNIKSVSLDTKLKRYSNRRGAMEIRFKGFGAVYLEYTLGDKGVITITRIGAVENPNVRLRTIV